MDKKERHRLVTRLYNRAHQELRRRHQQEFHEILEGMYGQEGVSVRKRLTGERKRQADIEKAKKILAGLDNSE